jgi:type I restriction enzyme S subunit
MSFEKLGDICDVIDSLHKTPKYSDIGKPMVRCTDVKYGELNHTNTFQVSDEVFAEFSKRYTPEVNDIIITRVGSYGITAQVKDINFCLGQNTSAIKPKNINPDYLYLVLNSKIVKDQIEFSVVGSTQKTLSLKAINNLDIPRFGDEIENQIAFIGASLDDKIINNTQTNQTLEQIAQAIFKSWFVDFDPVKAKMNGEQPEGMDVATASLFPEKLVESEFGFIPEGWDIKAIKDFGKVVTGKTPPQKVEDAYSEQGVPFVTPSDIDSDVFVCETKRFLSESGVEVVKKNVLPEGSICVTCIGSQMGKAVISPSLAISNQQINSVVVAKEYERNFLFLNLRRRREEIFLIGSSGSTMPIINKSTFEKLAVLTPSEALIQSFDKAVSALLNKIHQNALENQTLSSLRDTLLPKLLSGEMELRTSEELVEAI